MTEYRRAWLPGATWFFTVNLGERRGNRLWVDQMGVSVYQDALVSALEQMPNRAMSAVVSECKT